MARLFLSISTLLVVAVPPAYAHEARQSGTAIAMDQARFYEAASEHGLFSRAGFVPIGELHASGRQVRRLLLHGPNGTPSVRGIQIERLASGNVTLSFQFRNWSSEPISIDASAWVSLTSNDPHVFGTEGRSALARSKTSPDLAGQSLQTESCQGWTTFVEADQGGVARWSACDSANKAAYDYALKMIGIAVATKPGCAITKSVFYSFTRCFAPSEKLDDTALENEFARLRTAYGNGDVSSLLTKTRLAIGEGKAVASTQPWLSARSSVKQIGDSLGQRRASLIALRQLAARATNASTADRAKMENTIRTWRDAINADDSSYIGLLERLVWTESRRLAAPAEHVEG